uniref:Ferric-chelate reductase 1 n=1 Tax=Timema douglasi TaxID=61478 RepID=A0A7R8VJX8_TIMDO|nr:unnamed protein product [Timema douglasi]
MSNDVLNHDGRNQMLVALLSGCVLAVLVGRGYAYSRGAPDQVCQSMTPLHQGAPPQTPGTSPFLVTPALLQAGQGSPLKLMVSSPSELTFAGFFLQARDPRDPLEPLGTFTTVPGFAQAINCASGIRNAVTHVNSTGKKSLQFEWEPPADYEGPIQFNATFVQDYSTFWVGVLSDKVEVAKRSVNNPAQSTGISTTRAPKTSTVPAYVPEVEVKAAATDDPIYSGCGSTKSCFGAPDQCLDTKSCTAVTTVQVEGDRYTFEVKGKGAGYAAVALSEDSKMGDDSVMECARDSVQNRPANVYLSYNTGKTNARSSVTAGVAFHDVIYEASSDGYILSEIVTFASVSKLLLRLHGAFMIAAWIGAASVGILLARYFKQTWVGKPFCGKDQWFAWHRILMLLVWSLTITAFVLIFVELKSWSSEDNPHAILGTVTTLLAFFQPIGALFRPHPGSRRRPIFNWLHWLLGNMAHILAIVTIFFAIELSKAQLPEWTTWILVVYVAFHVAMHFVLSVVGCASERTTSSRVNSFPMSDRTSSRSPLNDADRRTDAPLSCFRKLLLALYLVVIIVLTVVLILVVVLAPIEETWEKFRGT